MFYKQNDDKKKVIQKRLCKFTAKYRNDTERRGIDEIKRNTKKWNPHKYTVSMCQTHREWRIDKILKNGGIDTCML